MSYLPNIASEVTREAHEHEVFFSFNSDEHAEWFIEWWNETGSKDFERYAKKEGRE